LFPIAVWGVIMVFVVTLLLSRIVSVSSVLASVSFPFFVVLVFHQTNWALITMSVLVGIFVPLTHLSNIKRLMNGTEKRFSWTRK
jgi:acyl phosphate:glycerol-3-phosphate acyltransferase